MTAHPQTNHPHAHVHDPTATLLDITADGGRIDLLDEAPAHRPPGNRLDRLPPSQHERGREAEAFWQLVDASAALAELLDVPATPTVAVVGSLEVGMAVARRSRARHWIPDDAVLVRTDRPELVDERGWRILDTDAEAIEVLDNGLPPSAMLVIDVPAELTVRDADLIGRLRRDGPALVRYVVESEPTSEDLATWHGFLGRPAVLDLADPVAPARVLQLLDQAAPVASVAGVAMSAELIAALRIEATTS